MKYISLLFLVLISIPARVSAHVKYVVDERAIQESSGADFAFLLEPLGDLQTIVIIIATVGVVALLYFLFSVLPPLLRLEKHINNRADSYAEFVPWILRLSLGIALIGAGSSGVLVSPALTSPASIISFFEILIGFLLLAGFLVVPSALGAIVLYIFGVLTDFYLIGNIEFVTAALALLILDNERPGLDDLIGLPKMSPLKHLERFVPLILRIGVGGAMVFLAIYEKFLNPHLSAIVVDTYALQSVVPVSQALWVFGAGVVELLIGLLILFGLRTRLTTIIAFFVLSLSFFYFGEDVYSHITLFGLLSALFVTRGGFLSLDHHLGIENKVLESEIGLAPERGTL